MSTAIEFFAGSGLVGEGLSPDFDLLWANDNGAKKADVFRVNHPHVPFHLGGIEACTRNGFAREALKLATKSERPRGFTRSSSLFPFGDLFLNWRLESKPTLRCARVPELVE